MSVMASWNGKTWGVSPERIAALNGVSASVELDTENSDDKAGSPATKTKALKLQSMSFDFDLGVAVGCDVRGEYASSTAKTASSCKPGKAKVTAIAKGKAHPYHLIAVSGAGSTVYGWTDAADIKTSAAATATSYLVKVTTDVLNIRKGPGTNYGTNGDIRDKGVYTIVAESDGPGASKWGKLKSGAGWISLDYTKKV